MGMHGTPHNKNKVVNDLLAHIGVKGTERWSLPKWSFSIHKNEAEATKAGIRAGVVRFLALQGYFHEEINLVLMMYSDLKTHSRLIKLR